MKKYWIVALVSSLGLVGCWDSSSKDSESTTKEEQSEKPKKVFPVQVEQVGPGELRRVLKSQARLESKRVANVSPLVSGRIENRWMEEGMIVDQGSRLIQLTTPPGVEIEMQRLELKIEQSELKLSRQKNLKERAPAAVADTTIEQAEMQLKELQLDLAKKREEADCRMIEAPFKGALNQVTGDIGQQVNTGTVLAKLHDLSELRISVDTTESRLHELSLNQVVRLTLLSDGSEAEGRISLIPSTIDEKTGSGKVIVTLKDRPDHWLAGAFVLMEFQMDIIEGDVVIEKRFIAYQQNRPYVWVAESKDEEVISKQAWVSVGYKDEEKAIITEGLLAGDQLIVSGLNGMREGMRLKLTPRVVEESSETE